MGAPTPQQTSLGSAHHTLRRNNKIIVNPSPLHIVRKESPFSPPSFSLLHPPIPQPLLSYFASFSLILPQSPSLLSLSFFCLSLSLSLTLSPSLFLSLSPSLSLYMQGVALKIDPWKLLKISYCPTILKIEPYSKSVALKYTPSTFGKRLVLKAINFEFLARLAPGVFKKGGGDPKCCPKTDPSCPQKSPHDFGPKWPSQILKSDMFWVGVALKYTNAEIFIENSLFPQSYLFLQRVFCEGSMFLVHFVVTLPKKFCLNCVKFHSGRSFETLP